MTPLPTPPWINGPPDPPVTCPSCDAGHQHELDLACCSVCDVIICTECQQRCEHCGLWVCQEHATIVEADVFYCVPCEVASRDEMDG